MESFYEQSHDFLFFFSFLCHLADIRGEKAERGNRRAEGSNRES